MLKIFR